MSSPPAASAEGSAADNPPKQLQQQQEQQQQQQGQQQQQQEQQQQQQEHQHCCRREFHALFFGRRQSARYSQHQTEAAAADLLADPFRLTQSEDEIQERKQLINKQLRLQLLLGGSILLVFAAIFCVIISLLLNKDDAREYLRMEPRLGGSGGGGNPAQSYGLVSLDRNNDDDLAGVLARIGAELSDYEIRRWYPRLLRAGRRPKDCDGLGAYPLPEREVCVPQLTGPLGACNLYTAFGYIVGDPCVLVKPGPALVGNYSEDLLLNCRAGVLDARSGSIAEELVLRYHPRVAHHGQMYGYFSRYYFPYPSDDSFYLAPMIMVQIVRPPRGRSFRLNCSLVNAALANASTQSSLQFLFG